MWREVNSPLVTGDIIVFSEGKYLSTDVVGVWCMFDFSQLAVFVSFPQLTVRNSGS